jgi:hypothetical protein
MGYKVPEVKPKRVADFRKEENGAGKYTDNNNYSTSFPSKKDLHVDAVEVPDCYKYIFNINNPSKQETLGNSTCLNKNQDKYKNSDNSYIQLPLPSHTNLYIFLTLRNHLCANMSYSDNLLVTSSTQRVRNKCFTIIYYKPIN